jgi:AP-2 complex subunit beta-1
MTMSNNDMVALFPDVVNCMSIPSLEIKKMCFLYLVHYARAKPDVALKALPVLVAVCVETDAATFWANRPRTWKIQIH